MQSLAAVCALLFLTFSVHAHVSEDFEGCRQFFYRNVWPVWPPSKHHREICQTYDNTYHFATLYDTAHRIPVYSAYVFEQSNDHPEIPWCIEPQLVKSTLDKNMMRADDLVKKSKVKLSDIEKVQAVYEDYQTPLKDQYEKGHLNPKGHHTGLGSKATYTLTNAVPQNKQLNNGAWSDYEGKLKKHFSNKKKCYKAYVLVGAIPSTNPENWIKRNNKKRVNIPSYLWHAYCCLNKSGEPIQSGAATAKNTENRVEECSLDSLQQFFKKLNKKPELFKDCKAPPKTEGDCSSVIQ